MLRIDDIHAFRRDLVQIHTEKRKISFLSIVKAMAYHLLRDDDIQWQARLCRDESSPSGCFCFFYTDDIFHTNESRCFYEAAFFWRNHFRCLSR